MNIGIDIDGTMQDFMGYMQTVGKEYFGRDPDPTIYNQDAMFGVTYPKIAAFWDKDEHNKRYTLEQPYFDSVAKTIRYIARHNEVIILTNRGWHHNGKINRPNRIYTKQALANNNISYNKIYYNKFTVTKGQTCHELGIDVMIEDSPEQIKSILQESPTTMIFVKRYPYNTGIKDVRYFDSWNEILMEAQRWDQQ